MTDEGGEVFLFSSEHFELVCEICVADNTEIEEDAADERGFVMSFVLLMDKLERKENWNVRVTYTEMTDEGIFGKNNE